MALKKKATPPTIEDRLAGVAATKAAALSIFEVAARDLDDAATEANEIRDLVLAEIDRLTEIANAAEAEAVDAADSAGRFRALILGKA